MVIRKLFWVAVFVALVPLLGLLEMDLTLRQRRAHARTVDENYNLPPARLLRGLSFGYNELAADLVWVRTINYFVDQFFQRRPYLHLERYLYTVLALDDRFKAVYRFGPAMLVSKVPNITNDDVRAAIRLSKRALSIYPDDWRFALNIGSYYMFELKTDDKEQKAAWVRMGADWTQRAALMGAGIDWLPSLAAKVYTKQGQRELAIRHLQELYLANTDEGVRRNILGKLRHLRAEHVADQLKEGAAAWEKRYKESPLRFVPPDLFVLLNPGKLKPFSLDDL